MILFGSAATAARNVRGEEYFNKMIEEAVKQKNLKTSNIQTEKSQEESEEQKLEKLVKRAVEREGVSDYEVEQLVLIYKDLAPEDTESPISIKMLNEFFENVVKPASPTGYAKLRKFYNFREYTCSEFKMRKFEIWRENFFKQFRTVEHCYQYSKGFKDMADRISKKLKAPESMGTVERCKWLRIWSVVLKDQGYHWKDVVNGRIDINQSRWFNKNFYFTPEVMISMEKDCFENVPDGALLLEMIQNLIALYPEDLQKEIRSVEEKTKNNTGLVLNIAFNYGGRDEIVTAVKTITQKVLDGKLKIDDITENEISNSLYTAGQPDPDLLIRTSGEERISNFLPWQISYSEFVFTDKYWPEYSNSDLLESIQIYQKRTRRFGGNK